MTALAVLLTATFAAGPALAGQGYRGHDRHGGGWDRYDRHEGHYRHENRRHRRHHRHGYRHAYRHAYRHSLGYPVYAHGGYGFGAQREAAYYCGPCRHRFNGYDELSVHVHRTHHIPIWRLPFVIVNSVLHDIVGFVFHG